MLASKHHMSLPLREVLMLHVVRHSKLSMYYPGAHFRNTTLFSRHWRDSTALLGGTIISKKTYRRTDTTVTTPQSSQTPGGPTLSALAVGTGLGSYGINQF